MHEGKEMFSPLPRHIGDVIALPPKIIAGNAKVFGVVAAMEDEPYHRKLGTPMDPLYTTSAISTGEGRNGRSRTNDGTLDVGLAVPTEMGGSGGGTNPEQLFAAGYAACFHSALQGTARQQKAAISDSAVTADVHMLKHDDGTFGLAVNLAVEMAGVDQETAEGLTAAAHKVCPYSNATKNNIDVTLETTTA